MGVAHRRREITRRTEIESSTYNRNGFQSERNQRNDRGFER